MAKSSAERVRAHRKRKSRRELIEVTGLTKFRHTAT
jgi:hypothetical protein